jgi:hypothetical protein
MRIQIRVRFKLITLMWVRIRIQLIMLMQMRIRILSFNLMRTRRIRIHTLILPLLSQFQYQICYLSIKMNWWSAITLTTGVAMTESKSKEGSADNFLKP